MNFESHDFRNMTSDAVYHYVKKRVVPGKRMYLFFDELQRLPPGKTRSILSGWTWTATPTLPAPTPICYPPSIPPISPDDAWRSKYCRSLSRSSWIFITLKFGKPAVPWAEPAGRYLIKTANATTHGRCLMPICVLGDAWDCGHRVGSGKSIVPTGRHLLHCGGAGYSGAGKTARSEPNHRLCISTQDCAVPGGQHRQQRFGFLHWQHIDE